MHAEAVALTCSPSKSEFLVIRDKANRSAQASPPHVTLDIRLNDVSIPEVQTIHILGMLLQNNTRNGASIIKL